MTTDFRTVCAQLIELWDADCDIHQEINQLREILAQSEPEGATPEPKPDVDNILLLAAIIREVDGNNRSGAARLAEDILSHPASRWGRPIPQPTHDENP